jgi:hypothetical protein
MIYLKQDPRLKTPLSLDHIKSRLLGHFGSAPGQSFTYLHFGRLIKKYGLDAFFISGPGESGKVELVVVLDEGLIDWLFDLFECGSLVCPGSDVVVYAYPRNRHILSFATDLWHNPWSSGTRFTPDLV